MKVENSYSSIFYEKTLSSPKTKEGQNKFSSVLEKTLGENRLDMTSKVLDELAQKYDVRNATLDEIGEIGVKLFNVGIISMTEFCGMGFDPDHFGECPMLQHTFFTTSADSNGRRDWVTEYEKRAERSLKEYNSIENYISDTGVAKVLKEISDYAKDLKTSPNDKN
ncbi:hypothetical protein KJ693_12420 [bacterium]|nr:hypothetical protein [bacterium]